MDLSPASPVPDQSSRLCQQPCNQAPTVCLAWSTHMFFESLNASLAPLNRQGKCSSEGQALARAPVQIGTVPPSHPQARIPGGPTPPHPWPWQSALSLAQSPSPTADILPATSTPRTPCCQLPASASEQAALSPPQLWVPGPLGAA